MGLPLAPSSSLPPLYTLDTLSKAQILIALHDLSVLYCRVPFPRSLDTDSTTDLLADSGYTSGAEEDEPVHSSDPDLTTFRADAFERSFVERWLTGFISRVENLAQFSSEDARQEALDQAAYILECFYTPEVQEEEEEEEEPAFTREFSFDASIPSSEETQKIKVQLNDGLAGTHDSDHQDVGLQSWGASIVLSHLMCTSPSRFGLTQLSSTPSPRIIELGAGTGLVSLVLGKLLPVLGVENSKIVATDYHPAVLANLCSNITTNFASPDTSSVEACLLDWASPSKEAPLDMPAKILLATDVVYAAEHARLLLDCATGLLAEDGIFWLLIAIRPNGKFAGIGDTVESAFAANDRPSDKSGRRLEIQERERLAKRKGIGRGDESHYEFFRIGWSN